MKISCWFKKHYLSFFVTSWSPTSNPNSPAIAESSYAKVTQLFEYSWHCHWWSGRTIGHSSPLNVVICFQLSWEMSWTFGRDFKQFDDYRLEMIKLVQSSSPSLVILIWGLPPIFVSRVSKRVHKHSRATQTPSKLKKNGDNFPINFREFGDHIS